MVNSFCKSCYLAAIDAHASDKFMLMSTDDAICSSCNKRGPVVAAYFFYGEQQVTPDGKRLVSAAKHRGVNLDYCPWGTVPFYKD